MLLNSAVQLALSGASMPLKSITTMGSSQSYLPFAVRFAVVGSSVGWTDGCVGKAVGVYEEGASVSIVLGIAVTLAGKVVDVCDGGKAVGSALGTGVGTALSTVVGIGVGTELSTGVGTVLETGLGTSDGKRVGARVGSGVGAGVGTFVGTSVGVGVSTVGVPTHMYISNKAVWFTCLLPPV